MAKSNIDDVFNGILSDCQSIAVAAVKNASKKVQENIIDKANTCLQQYYANYDPFMYERTYNLKKAIVPYWSDTSSADTVSIEVGVEYSSDMLVGAYRSNSHKHQSGDKWKSVVGLSLSDAGSDNGIPESGWILSHYLSGSHPWAKTDSESTEDLMTDFFDNELPNNIAQYVQEELIDAILSKL